ncbi:CpsD/CapB family tyrosine-protein kinase [Pseudophaeobacter sp.]|uniref:CpsD/CapB family tyrosine-protein kinase n=1 Tax=Pseudophaeobacter sp. TaxID=1971739 RepID=UPI004059AECD
MKHFAVSTPVSTSPAGAIEQIDDEGMTQKGFKRFQRRSTKARELAQEGRRKREEGLERRPGDDLVAEPTCEGTGNSGADLPQERAVDQEVEPMLLAQEAIVKPPQATATLAADLQAEEQAFAPAPRQTVARRKPASAAQRHSPVTPDPIPTSLPPLQLEPQMGLPARFDPWTRLPQVPFDFLGQQPSALPLVSAFRTTPTARAFDLLRTRLLHSLKEQGWKRVAITSPVAGGGTTFCAVNLALSLARVAGSRTLLMDMNLRSPGVAAALGITPQGDMAAFLTGKVALTQHLQRLSETLAVGCNALANANAAEVLHDPRCANVIDIALDETQADTVIFDLPPILEHDDLTAFLPQVDGVLLVSDGEQTTAADLAACEKMLAGHAPLLGVVLNRAPKSDKPQITS